MFKAKDKSFNEDEKSLRSPNNFVEIRFLRPLGVEIPPQVSPPHVATAK